MMGALQGSGRAVALQLARGGVHCFHVARNSTKLIDVASEITANGGTPFCMTMDLADVA
jgi:short-subunit dehydrogenase